MLSGSEDVIGPLLIRAPRRVCVKQDAPIVDLLRRVNCDIEESRNHEIVRENDLLSVSDGLFHVPEEVKGGSGHKTQPFILSAELHQGGIKMDLTWDEDSILRQSIQGLLNEIQAILRDMKHVSLDMTVDDFMSV